MTEINWQELAYTLFEEAGDALFLFDPESEQLQDVNPVAQRLSGFSRRELLQMKITYLFRTDASGGLNRLRQAFRRTGLFHSQEGFWLRHKKEGAWTPVNLTITRLHTEPRTLGLITARDIREQREAHAQLKKMESELRRVTDSVSDCLWSAEVDSAGHWVYTYFSPVVAKIAGRPADYFLPGPERWLNTVHAADRTLVEKAFVRLRASQSGSAEYRLLWPDGSTRWVRDSVMVTRGTNGQHLLLDGVISDITERRHADDALRDSESRQRLLIEQMPAILWTTDNALVITSSVGAGLSALQMKPNQTTGMRLAEVLETEDPEYLPTAAHLRALQGESVSYEMRWRGRDFQTHIEPLRDAGGAVAGCIGVALDITERKKAEEALHESQRALLTLLSNLPGMAYRCRNDPDWTIEFVSEGAVELTGYSPDDFVGSRTVSFTQLIHPDDRARVWSEVQRAVKEERSFRLLYRIRAVDGSEKWVWEQGRGVVNAERTVVALEGFITDITERKRAEEATRSSEAKYRSLIENLAQSIFLKDRDLRYLAVNEHFCRSLGRSEEEIVGKTDLDFYPDDVADKYRDDDLLVLSAGNRLVHEEPMPLNGTTRTVQTIKSPVRDETGKITGVLGIFWDVTDQRSLEAQLRQAQKMDAIGQLAGGIAHDFNNLLTAVLGNLELVQTELPREHACHELLAHAIKAGFRAAELTRQLLSFARQTPLRPGLLDLNTSVDETVRLLRRTIDPRISVSVQAEPELWGVQADAAQMGQVLMNLCLNARDAMADGGTLTLSTRNLVLGAEPSTVSLSLGNGGKTDRRGEFVCLSVSDTGAGMPAEVLAHLFEPFFTTKGPGKGTGLGLAMVFGIIKQHDGWIECHSQPGQGARFDIFLPRHSASPAPVFASNDTDVPRGSETILLADDHEMVRRLGKDILERQGYCVLIVADGQEALESYRAQMHAIDLVILDLAMPRLSGTDTLKALRALNPHVCVLVSSGYYTEQAIQAVEREGAAGFVPKPYRPSELARSVRAALDQKAVGSMQ